MLWLTKILHFSCRLYFLWSTAFPVPNCKYLSLNQIIIFFCRLPIILQESFSAIILVLLSYLTSKNMCSFSIIFSTLWYQLDRVFSLVPIFFKPSSSSGRWIQIWRIGQIWRISVIIDLFQTSTPLYSIFGCLNTNLG